MKHFFFSGRLPLTQSYHRILTRLFAGGEYTFTSQEQIDNFQVNYPGCTEIEGDVSILGNSVSNLIGLNVITSIGGNFTIMNDLIYNSNLESLTGLENLTSITGNFQLKFEDALTNLTGLENLTWIGGNLEISGNEEITGLTGLESLTSLGGHLSIADNNSLASLTGLENLTSITGGLTISSNYVLTSLAGLQNLAFAGGNIYILLNHNLTNLTGLENLASGIPYLDIANNFSLTSLTGLENQSSVGHLYITGNSSLTSLSALENLTSLGLLEITGNNALTSLTGLEYLVSIDGNLTISFSNALSSLTGLENLISIGDDLIVNLNPGLISLSGIENLISIGGALIIGGNDQLHNLAGLENLTSLGDYIEIQLNDDLSSLTGIENINAGTIGNLTIQNNPSLNNCAVQSICDYLVTPNGTIEIENNAPGCNSPSEVQEACLSLSCLPEGITFTTQEQIDNFQTNYPGCTEIEGNVMIKGWEIIDLTGLNVLTAIGGALLIDSTMISNYWGLHNLVSIGDFLCISYNYNLSFNNLSGFEALSAIGGPLCISFSKADSLTGMPSITSIGGLHLYMTGTQKLSGLETLTHIDGDLTLHQCFELTDISALQNITSINGGIEIFDTGLSDLFSLNNIVGNSITSLNVSINQALSECAAQSICDYLAAPNGVIIIQGNAPGCNSPEEVAEHCLTSQEENPTAEVLLLFPNPAISFITIQIKEGNPIEKVIIYNHLGQKVLETKPVNNKVDVSKLKPGIYFLEVITSENRTRTKLLIE